MKEAVIVSAVRTAVGKAPKGTLKNTRSDEMGAVAIKEAVAKADATRKTSAKAPTVNTATGEIIGRVPKLGAKETKSPDFLSMLMFQPDYIRHLIDLGEEDFANRAEEIVIFLR